MKSPCRLRKLSVGSDWGNIRDCVGYCYRYMILGELMYDVTNIVVPDANKLTLIATSPGVHRYRLESHY